MSRTDTISAREYESQSKIKMNSYDLTPRSRLSKYAKAASCLVFVIVCTHCCDAVFADTSAETEAIEPDRFEKEVVASSCTDAIAFDISADSRIVFVERKGAVKTLQLRDAEIVLLAQIPIAYIGEVGLVGMALDNDFVHNGWIYLSFCPASAHSTMRVSRFTITGNRLDLVSEKKLFDYHIDEPAAYHMGGGLAMDGQGNLYMGTGDNSPPIAELPIDQRPGKEFYDALRSSGNTNDLRGKILRVHPRVDGGYDIPTGNLFPDGKEGRPEIYCMGCRNPFRVVIDRKTGWVYWGDVGPNILDPTIKIGPDGYDEINQARKAGNFGWPLFVGPNEAYKNFDFVTRKTGALFDVNHPVNFSRNNTGAKELPPPQPAWIWYPNIESKTFPELGSGGRSAMAGPTYHHAEVAKSPLRLPASYDGAVFIFDWMRNWIKTVRLNSEGQPDRIEPFLPQMTFRKPIDMKFGQDGCLYLIDYGTNWTDNADGQILRIVYRRGNRPPVAKAKATPEAGKQPLHVRFTAKDSFDKDAGEQLSFAWRLGPDKPVISHKPEQTITFDKPGTYPVEVAVSDSHGATSVATVEIRVGNARPTVTFQEPRHGGFFDWGDRVRFQAEATDEEDGNSQKNAALRPRLRVQGQYFAQRPGSTSEHEGLLEPGLALMRQTTCFSCHSVQVTTGGGPPYSEVGRKYHDQPAARDQLARKILSGGTGVWGAKIMPAHPQHSLEQARLMVDWVLSLAAEGMGATVDGADGVIQLPPAAPPGRDAGVYVLSASYADQGADGAPSLTGEATLVQHSRKKQAVACDRRHGVELVEVFVVGPAGRFSNGGWIAFDDMDLHGIDQVVCAAAQVGMAETMLELHADAPDGPLLGAAPVPGSAGAELFVDVTIPLQKPTGPCTLFVVARAKQATDGKVATLRDLRFLDSPTGAEEHKREQQELATLPISPPAAVVTRTIVKEWTVDDLLPVFDDAGRGRSFERGKALFNSSSCAACHQLRKEGGTIAPDLAESIPRLNRDAHPKDAILREIVTPSAVVDPKYRTVSIITNDGITITGLIVRQDDRALFIVANPLNPNEVKKVLRSNIDERLEQTRSIMPDGLLNTLSADEIADLLAYVRSGGDPHNPIFQE